MKSFPAIVFVLLTWALVATASDRTNEYEYGDEEASLPWVEIKQADNFDALGRAARDTGKVIMLEMSAPYCGYCRTLEEEIIKPMLRNDDFDRQVFIRKLDISSNDNIIDFNGSKTTPAQLASRYRVFVTPTLIFIDGNGREASPRILGVNTLEFYGGYVDEALNEAYRKINNPKYVYQTR